ncbi:hybrid signal transduction histidine kinase M [Tanacetum coccineum]
MTEFDNPLAILLLDKLSTVTHHHLFMRVLVKLDLENWNYASLEYFFGKLCQGYEVSKYIHGSSDATSISTSTPFTPKELKVDTVFLLWIFATISDTLQERLVMEHPQSAKEAWDLIIELVKDNKRSHTIALKAKLRSLTLGDMSIDTYFWKTGSIATILTSLGSPVTSEYVVTFALEGLPDKYDHVCVAYHSSARQTMVPLGLIYYPSLAQQFSLVPQPMSLVVIPTQQAQSMSPIIQTASHPGSTGPTVTSGQETALPHAFTAGIWIQDFMTHWVLLWCDSIGDLYPIMAPSPIPHAFLVSQHTWHQRLGHQGSKVLRHLVSNNFISCNKEKPPVLYHAC